MHVKTKAERKAYRAGFLAGLARADGFVELLENSAIERGLGVANSDGGGGKEVAAAIAGGAMSVRKMIADAKEETERSRA